MAIAESAVKGDGGPTYVWLNQAVMVP